MNILLLMMGGSGTRFGSDTPKQFVLYKKVPVFAYILQKYNAMDDIDRIVLVSHIDWLDYVQKWSDKIKTQKEISVVAGGATRSESVLNGLLEANKFASKEDIVLIHDATHPYVDEEGTKKVIQYIKRYGGATLGALQYDTVYRMDENNIISEIVPRTEIIAGASPEGFRFSDIFSIYTQSSKEELDTMTSAGAIALAHGIRMAVVPINVLNLKITHQRDMELFKRLADNYFFEKKNDVEN